VKTLTGKVAIVTGASKGIGAAAAKALAAEGAAAAVNYSSEKQRAERVVSQITREDGKANAIQAHDSKAVDVRRMFDKTKESSGR
jgi:3-oxoacyl-[acyl-carrier protein] reductase